MSDVSQGQGWWIASDGKWYPPELHPSVQPPTAPASAAGSHVTATAASATAPERGPRFPDLFERARHANAVADTVSVRADGATGPDDFFAPIGVTTVARRGKRRHR
jgi:hypothetical protein